MSEYRPIKQKIWHDEWFCTLNPEERCFWLFLLTNEFTHISGIYELPKPLITPLSGCPEGLNIFEKFIKEDKIRYKNGFVFIRNYIKNQTKEFNKKDNIFKAVMAYLSQNQKFIEWFELEKEEIYKPLISPLPPPMVKRKEESNKDITPNGDLKPMYKEPIIQLDESGEEIQSPVQRKTFGKYPALIAKFYCELVGKTSASRQLPASKELLQIAQKDFPNDSIEEWDKEIKARIVLAKKYYEKIKKVNDWNLIKVAENWNKILKEWKPELNKYQ